VFDIIVAKLLEMESDVRWLLAARGGDRPTIASSVHQESFFAGGPERVPPRTVSLSLTSPPYLDNYHYVRNTRPQMYWLGLVSEARDTTMLAEESFGKFWQTVRDWPEVALSFDHPGLKPVLRELRAANAERGPSGGPAGQTT